MEEIDYFLAAFREKGTEPFKPDHIIEIGVSNIVCSINFGRRFDYKDPQFQLLVDMIYRFSEIGTNAAAVNIFPILMKMPIPEIREVFQIDKIMKKFLYSMIDQHKDTRDPSIQRDFIDAYLCEIERRKLQSNDDNDDVESTSAFTERYLYHILNDMIFAGTETMSSTIRWGLLYMIVYPEIQEKVYQELVSVVGQECLPSITDKCRLPYTEATLMEIQRMANITALTFPHKTTKDTELEGYEIPKDTPIYVNLYSVHVDPAQWKEPEIFRPERFLNEEGRVVHTPALMPFSAGKLSWCYIFEMQ